MSEIIGISLQKIIYEISGDTRKLTETELRYRFFQDAIEKLSRSKDAQTLFFYDENVVSDFITEWSAHGEWRANQFVQEEVVRLSQQPGYDPCILNKVRESSTND